MLQIVTSCNTSDNTIFHNNNTIEQHTNYLLFILELFMKKSLILITTLASLTIGATAYAKHHDPEKFIARMTEKLTLDTTQQAQFRAFVDEKKQLKAQYKAYKKERKENPEKAKQNSPMAALLEQKTISADQIRAAIEKKQAEKLDRRAKLFSTFATFYNGLSEQQQAKVKPKVKKLLSLKKKRKKGAGKEGKGAHHGEPKPTK